MKVLFTHERFAPDFAGGGEVVALETARRVMKKGVGVKVLTTGNPRLAEYEGIPTTRLPVHRYRFNLAVRQIAGMARDVDLVHTFNYHACLPSLVAARWVNKPVVCMILGLFHKSWLEMRGPVVGRLWMAWEYFLVRRAFSRLIYVSDYSRELGLAMGGSPERSVVISPGIELEKYKPAPQKEDHVLFVGKLDPRKGIHDVLAVATDLPEVKFRVIGWGPREQEYRRAAPANVEFVPFMRGKKLREAFSKARIFVCASSCETFGIAILEAMASACAVVSTIPFGFKGPLIPVGDRDAMKEAISRLWNDRNLTDRLGAGNAELAQVYSWERYVSQMMRLYADVVHEA